MRDKATKTVFQGLIALEARADLILFGREDKKDGAGAGTLAATGVAGAGAYAGSRAVAKDYQKFKNAQPGMAGANSLRARAAEAAKNPRRATAAAALTAEADKAAAAAKSPGVMAYAKDRLGKLAGLMPKIGANSAAMVPMPKLALPAPAPNMQSVGAAIDKTGVKRVAKRAARAVARR